MNLSIRRALLGSLCVIACSPLACLETKRDANGTTQQVAHDDPVPLTIVDRRPGTVDQPKGEADPRYLASVKELGTAESVVAESEAFIFFEGRYLGPPYSLRRNGYGVSLNGVTLRRLPAIPEDYEEVQPTYPPNITRNTSWQEIDKVPLRRGHWLNRIQRWFMTHYPPPEAQRRFADQIRRLPFVKEATWIPPEGEARYLRIVSHAGDERHLFTSWWDPERKEDDPFPTVSGFPLEDRFRPFTPGYLRWIRDDLERTFQTVDRWLKSGEIVILGEGGPVRAQRGTPQAQSIVEVVELLKSEMAPERKTMAIYNRLLDSVSRTAKPEATSEWITISALVERFAPDPKLDARIEKLKSQQVPQK